MRIHKFRAWNKYSHKMFNWDDIKGDATLEEAFEDNPDNDGCPIMEYIGLHDIKRKEIYDGDIVRHYNNDKEPEYFEIGVIFWDKDNCRFMRTSKYKENYNVTSKCKYEVIGNIYENHELLEANYYNF